MNDDASRPDGELRGLHRGTGEQRRARGWFAEEADVDPRSAAGSREASRRTSGSQAGSPQPRRSESGNSRSGNSQSGSSWGISEQRSLEQRYADAVTTMNRIVSTLDFDQLPWVRDVFRTTASSMSEQDPARAAVFNNLGSACQLAYLHSRDPLDLSDAISYYRTATSVADDEDTDLVLYTCNLALALTDQAAREGDATNAEQAVAAARAAVDQLAEPDQRRVMALMRLGNALKLHSQLTDESGPADEAIVVFREAIRSAGVGSSVPTSEVLIDLGTALLRRYERAAATEDLDEGIAHLRTGVDGLADGEARRRALCQLSNALRLRFQRNGDLDDLDVAMNELLGVLGVLGPGHPLLGTTLSNLACTAAEHADSTGEPSRLRQATHVLPNAMRGLAAEDSARLTALSCYGGLLRRQFLHGAPPTVLDTAVAAGEAALEVAGTRSSDKPSSSDRPGSSDKRSSSDKRCAVMNSLTTTLLTRYEHNGDTSDLERAAEIAENTVALASRDTPPHHTASAQLGLVAVHRFRLTGRSADLESSIEQLDRAMRAMPDNAPGRAAIATQLGRSLQMLHQKTGRKRLYRWAQRVLTEAAEQATAPADERVRAANLCGRLAANAHRWSEALDSFTTAVELLPLVTRGKHVVGSSTAHRRWAWIAADAAACALEKGEPKRAVELLEHGHCALLGDFLPASGELGDLYQDLPDLADEAIRLRRLLDRPPYEMALTYVDVVDDSHRENLANAWAELLREARTKHRSHARIPEFDQLAPAGNRGAVVMVNLSQYRSDALVVFAGRVLTVPLPGADPESARQLADNALTAADQHDSHALSDALDWVWHNISKPVLTRMGYVSQPREGQRWPRIWWHAFGPQGFLPLHAATAREGASALDRVISSYAPSLSKLVEARNRPARTGQPAMVAAGSAERVARELPRQNRILAHYWPNAEIFSTEETDASSMLRAVPEHPWMHSCEPTVQYPAHPAAGVLLERETPDRSLKLVDLGQTRLDEAEFAYLGDCVTAPETPSQAGVPLATALGFAGFAHVIGTLWGMDQRPAAWVHANVYGALFGDSEPDTDRSAEALHATTRQLRTEHPDDPVQWAAPVHVGR